jgi:hypothetical protein
MMRRASYQPQGVAPSAPLQSDGAIARFAYGYAFAINP